MTVIIHCLVGVAIFAVIQKCSCTCEETSPSKSTNKADAIKYLEYLEQKVCFEGQYQQVTAEVNYYKNITPETFKIYSEQMARPPLFDAEFKSFDWDSFNDPYLKREAKLYTLLDKSVDPAAYKAYGEAVAKQVDASNKDFVRCVYKQPTVCGEKADEIIAEVVPTTKDPDELLFYWMEFRQGAPKFVRPLYKTFVDAANKVAQAKGYANRAEQIMGDYEDPPISEFQKTFDDVYAQIKPFYDQVFSYSRGRLRDIFGPKIVSKSGPIPVHLFSVVKGTDVSHGFKEMKPYPNKIEVDVTEEMKRQNYTIKKIIDTVEDFFQSLGLESLPESFYKLSMFELPNDGREVDCGSAWDFFNRKDYCVITCGVVSYPSIGYYAHEFGHVHNFIAYKNQPCCFRNLAAPGIDEVIADSLALSFKSYKAKQRLGLILDECEQDEESVINNLYDTFGDTFAFAPLTLLDEIWRWNVFNGKIEEKNYNKAYWDLKLKYQGVIAGNTSNLESYLDPAANNILVDDTGSLPYFLTFVVEFQFFEALCIEAGQYNPNDPNTEPLYNCDIYGSKKAGKLWHKVLELGSSKPWTAALEILTGKPQIDATAAIRYFEPLLKFMKAENERRQEFIGWK